MKRPTGIPVDSMVFVDEPLPGTYKTHTGKYAVPKIDVLVLSFLITFIKLLVSPC